MAARAHVTGATSLALLVGIDGQVQRARIQMASGDDFMHRLLDMTALAALSKCPIQPGSIDGKPVPRWMSVRYEWRLE